MGNQLSLAEIVGLITGAAAIVTFVWHAAMYAGKLTVRQDGHELRLRDHEERLNDVADIIGRHTKRIDDHDGELRFIKRIRSQEPGA